MLSPPQTLEEQWRMRQTWFLPTGSALYGVVVRTDTKYTAIVSGCIIEKNETGQGNGDRSGWELLEVGDQRRPF